jgi:hypothetical protein
MGNTERVSRRSYGVSTSKLVMGNSSIKPNHGVVEEAVVDLSGDDMKDWNIVLCGDSTIDNKGYCKENGTSVTEHFQARVGKVTMRAQDGSVISGIEKQLASGLPSGTTHLVVSVGGNNLLIKLQVMRKPCLNVTEAILLFSKLSQDYEAEYEKMIQMLLAFKKPIILCAIYRPNFERTGFYVNQEAVDIALTIFHDIMYRLARKYRLPIVNLRSIIGEAEDFANPIELGTPGGLKMTNAILDAIQEHQKLGLPISVVYPQ